MPGKKKHEQDEGERRSFSQAFGRFWGAIFFVVIIGYVSMLLIGRTEGFRGIVSDRLEGALGVPVTIGASRITPTLEILLEEVKGGVSSTNQATAMEAKRVAVRLRAGGLLKGSAMPLRSLAIDGAVFRFSSNGENEWQPLPALAGALLRWAVVAGRAVEERDAAFAGLAWFRERGVALRLDDTDFFWRDRDGSATAWIEDVDFDAKAIRPFEESALWSRLRAGVVGSVWNEVVEGLEVEWIHMAGRDVVLKVKRN